VREPRARAVRRDESDRPQAARWIKSQLMKPCHAAASPWVVWYLAMYDGKTQTMRPVK
jgi:hypothetical protein